MSDTSATGGGGSVAPGWYTDPQNPSQLRWWSGEGWTEHVSGGAPTQDAGQAAQQAEALAASEAAEAAIRAQQAQLAQQQAEALAQQQAQAQAAAEAQALAQAQAAAQAEAQAQAAAQAQAEAQAQAQAQREAAEAQQALLAQQAQAAAAQQVPAQQVPAQQVPAQQVPAQQFPPQQQQAAPISSTPSAPVPTLPVQPRSFLEQAGYAPLDGVVADSAGVQPPAPMAAVQPEVAPAASAPQAVPAAPQPFVPPQTSNTVQPLSASAWDQAAQEIAPFNDLTPPPPNQWSAPPVAPTAAPAQNAWGTPPAAAAPTTPAAGQDGLDSLFSAPAAPAAPAPVTDVTVPAADSTASAWGLAPTGQDEQVSRRRNTDAAPQIAGSTTVWVWLIAVSPIIAAGAIGYILATTGYVLWTFEAAVAAPYLLVVLFALADRAGLQTLGHSEPRSPGWALLTAPVYLIMRAAETRREDGSGTMFTLVWFVSFLVAIAGFVGYGFLTGHPLVTGLPS